MLCSSCSSSWGISGGLYVHMRKLIKNWSVIIYLPKQFGGPQGKFVLHESLIIIVIFVVMVVVISSSIIAIIDSSDIILAYLVEHILSAILY